MQYSPDDETKKAAKEKFKAKLDVFIKNIEKVLEENGGEWLVGKDFTWADLYVAAALHQVRLKKWLPLFCMSYYKSLSLQWTELFAKVEWEDKTPKLLALTKKVHDIPKIKAHLESRPDAPF